MRSSWIPRRRRLLVVVAVAALLPTAIGCSSSDKSSSTTTSKPKTAETAATVAGTDVRLADVTADLKAEAAAGKKGKAQTDPSSPLASPKAKAGGYTPAATAAALTNRILFELYGQQLKSHKATVAAADKERARQSLCADATTGQAPTGDTCPPLDAYSAAYRTFQLTLRERELAFGKVLYGRVFDTVKRTKPAVLNEICLNLVQVATKDVSDQVLKDMKAGKSMADASKTAAAAGKSSEVQPGCLFTAVAPANVAKAKKGAVIPVSGQSALGVAEVTSLKTATKAEFASQPPSSDATVQKLIKSEVDQSIRKAKITVLAKYGKWDSSQLVVVPPKDTSKKTTTTTATTAGPTTTGTVGTKPPATDATSTTTTTP